MKREIVYHIFLECSKHTEDNFWKYIFEDLAYCKPPYGSYISKGFIYCNYKGKEFSYKIEEKDPKVMFEELYILFKKKLGLSSVEDKSKSKVDLNDIENENIFSLSWPSIKKKSVKDFIIENYIIEMKSLFSLSIPQTKNLLAVINIAFIFKKLNSEDVTFKDGKILKIKGINFKNKEIIYSLNMYNCI